MDLTTSSPHLLVFRDTRDQLMWLAQPCSAFDIVVVVLREVGGSDGAAIKAVRPQRAGPLDARVVADAVSAPRARVVALDGPRGLDVPR